MLPERPNINEYARLLDEVAELKDRFAKVEYEYDKLVAVNIRDALRRGAKTTEIPSIKVIGCDEDGLQKLNALKEDMFKLKKSIGETLGRIQLWQAKKDLYTTDSYHTIRGSMRKISENENEEE